MHSKRSSMPKNWPLPRKGNAYYLVASHAKKTGIPLVIALRDILKIVKTYKEAKLMTMAKDVKVNGKARTNEKFPLQISDILTLEKAKKNYLVEVSGKRIRLVEIDSKDATSKITKISGKKLLSNKKVQLNLDDGNNHLFEKEFSVGDSAIVNLKDGKIEKILSLKVGAKIKIISGKHSGEEGTLKEIIAQKKSKFYLVKLKESEVELPLKTLLVVG